MQSTNDSGTPSATPRTVVFGRVRVSLLNFATRAEAMFLGGHFYLHVGCATVREGSGAHHITRETTRAGRVPSVGTERAPHKRVGGDFLLSQNPIQITCRYLGATITLSLALKRHLFVECVFVSEWKPAETCLSLSCLLLIGFGHAPS